MIGLESETFGFREQVSTFPKVMFQRNVIGGVFIKVRDRFCLKRILP